MSNIFSNRVRAYLPFKLSSVALLAIAACSGTAAAADGDFFSYNLNGFATVGVVHATEKHADFTSTGFKPNGAGYTRNWSADPDSRVGGQLDVHLGEKWTATLQLVSEQNWDNSYTPHVEWANIKYAVTPDLSVRVGRVALPTYMFSDSRKVGYSTPTVRSPMFFYEMIPFHNNDGVDLSYRFHVGDVTNTTVLMYGRADVKSPAPGDDPFLALNESRDSVGFTNRTEYGNLSFQLSHYKTNFSMPGMAAAAGPAIAQLVTNAQYTITELGFDYEPGQWFVLGELAQDHSPWSNTRRGGYLSAGYRLGQFTPYGTFEVARPKRPGPPEVLPLPFNFNALALGTRWDFAKNMDLKLQFERHKLRKDAFGTLVNIQPSYVPGGAFNVVSLAADFVF